MAILVRWLGNHYSGNTQSNLLNVIYILYTWEVVGSNKGIEQERIKGRGLKSIPCVHVHVVSTHFQLLWLLVCIYCPPPDSHRATWWLTGPVLITISLVIPPNRQWHPVYTKGIIHVHVHAHTSTCTSTLCVTSTCTCTCICNKYMYINKSKRLP